MLYSVPFGHSELQFKLPVTWDAEEVDIAERPLSPPALEKSAIEGQLTALAEQIKASHSPGQQVVAVFTDATRACPDQQLLEPVLHILKTAEIPVTCLCAIGMHRPSTREEKIAKLGPWIVENFPVIDHDPQQTTTVTTIEQIPVELNPVLLNATVLMAGVVEPHQYAGYSGGAKTAIIGCGGSNTIARTHSPEFLDKPGTRPGEIESNPFQQFIRMAGTVLNPAFAINVVLNDNQKILYLETGEPDEVHDRLIEQARSYFEIPVPRSPYDIVIAGVGAPKDANLYQASRAATYIGLSHRPVLRKGGVLIVPAPIPEGAGQGTGEQNFIRALHDFGPTLNLMNNLREYGCKPGEQRAYMLARLLEDYHLMIVGAEHSEIVMDAWLHVAMDMEDAARRTVRLTGDPLPRVLIVPHAIQSLPVPAVAHS